jgi:hypothetical protein
MKKEKTRTVRESLVRVIAGVMLIGIGLSCGTSAFASDRRNVWERADQFVAVEKQDGVAPTPNDHPAKLAPETIRATLANLRVQLEGSKEPSPLLTEGELEILGGAVQQGLGLAASDEDVTFALVGLHPALLGLFKQPMVTTGRLFVRDGRLNLILGLVYEPVSDRDDRRLKPFVPGSRVAGRRPEWRVTSKNGETVQVESDRTGWLVLPLVAAAPPLQPTQTEISPGVKPGAGAPVIDASPRPPGKSVEERLIILNELMKKGLITDEEYKAKRLQIMNEL